MGSLPASVAALVIYRTCPCVNRSMPELRHLMSSWASLRRFCCLSLLSLASTASRAAFASAARCFSALLRCLAPVSRGVAASPSAVSAPVSMVPGWQPTDSPLRNCRQRPPPQLAASGGALAPVLCELSIPLYCMSLSRSRRVSSPSYPWTLELRPRRTQLAWNAPGLASPSSLIETGDQSDLKWLNPAL